MQIPETVRINELYYLSHSPSSEDIPSLVENANDIDVFNGTLRMPFPYTLSDAEKYVAGCREQKIEFGKPMKWQVRNNEGVLCGSIALLNQHGKGSHKDELGYWLGKHHRNKGLMTHAIKAFSTVVFQCYDLVRLEATIFSHNIPSQKVAEKCGFIYEGTLKKAYFKDGKYIDGKLYALVK